MTVSLAAPKTGRPRILAVDDQPENLELLGAILADEGYEAVYAVDGEEALEAVGRFAPQAILLDIMMPKLDGLEVCARLKRSRRTCFIPVVMLTALSDVASKVRALEAGADDFLNKPFHRIELVTRLRSLLRIRALRDELDSTEAVIFSMIALLEGKDPRTRGHSQRVAAVAADAARALGVGAGATERVVQGALLHDIGKIGVPERILFAPTRDRTPAEESVYRQHVELGERILAPIESLAGSLPLVRFHHERLDGSGYPDGLSGADFRLEVEIVAAANAHDMARILSGRGAEGADHELRAAARERRFHREVAEAVVAASEKLPERIPPAVDLLPAPAAETSGAILVADDSATNRMLYADLLGGAGYRVTVLESSEAVEAAVEDLRPDLVLLDVRMPRVSGEEICRRLKEREEAAFLPVVLVTAWEGREARLRGLASGADEFLIAPVHRLELLARVRSLLRLRSYHLDLVRHESVVLSLSAALEAKDPYTRGHSGRVAALAERLARELGLPQDFGAQMRSAGLLHDIGKVAVPEQILQKPSPLTQAELAVLMTHPAVGFDICRPLRTVGPLLDGIRYHHERFDGRGYPDGLAGEAIPLGARVLAVADALDALTSDRPYRGRLPLDEALRLLTHEAREGKWDPRVFAALEALARRGELDLRHETS